MAIWHLLADKVAYRDLGADYYARRNPKPTMRHIAKQTSTRGLTVRVDPIPRLTPNRAYQVARRLSRSSSCRICTATSTVGESRERAY